MAHEKQQCTNFKDPGLQDYGGNFFRQCVEEADSVFVSLPAPVPSLRAAIPMTRSVARDDTHDSPPVLEEVNMSRYHNSGNPCFAGHSMVTLSNGEQLRVDKVRKGDVFFDPLDKNGAKVLCVIKTKCFNNIESLVSFPSGLCITPYHPIRIQGQWVLPATIYTPCASRCPFVFNFILERGHVARINDIDCVTMGHSFLEDGVRHAYFGSKLAIEDLSGMRGWVDGLIEFKHNCIRRMAGTGMVMGFDVNRLAC